MNLAVAGDHLRTLADSTHPLAAGAIRDAQLRTALKTALDYCDTAIDYQTERDELDLAAPELHDLLHRAANVLDAYPGPFEPDDDWNVYTLARQAREGLEVPPCDHGRRLLAELDAAHAWRYAVRAMAAACDHDDPGATRRWAQTLRIAEQVWRQATPRPCHQSQPTRSSAEPG